MKINQLINFLRVYLSIIQGNVAPVLFQELWYNISHFWSFERIGTKFG